MIKDQMPPSKYYAFTCGLEHWKRKNWNGDRSGGGKKNKIHLSRLGFKVFNDILQNPNIKFLC